MSLTRRFLAAAVVLLGAAALATEPSVQRGAAAYAEHCARCHQADGRGVENTYPALRGSDDLFADRDRAIRAVLLGRTGPTVVDGEWFSNIMPTHGFIGNETVADIVNFLFHEWGEGGALASASDVAEQRRVIIEQAPRHPRAWDPEVLYESTESPLADVDVTPYVTGEGPPMTVADYNEASRLYYARCTGCHGVFRQGIAGAALTPEAMRGKGTEYLKAILLYGSQTGMPNWGTSDALTPREMSLLAEYLQHPVARPPAFALPEIQASWQRLVPKRRRSSTPHGELFAVALHGTGEIALFDAARRRLVTTVDVGYAPHLARVSASNRYLAVAGRDGTVSLIDLNGRKPRKVASVRIGFEARALDVSRHPGFEDRYVLAGAFWPPQAVLLDGETLEPIRHVTVSGQIAGTDRHHPEPRVTDVIGATERPEFVVGIKETGHLNLLPYADLETLQIVDVEAAPHLRAGSFDLSGRYYLVSTDLGEVVVLDSRTRNLVARIPVEILRGGSRGAAFVDPEFGPVWATGSMRGDRVVVIGTDPEEHPQHAWQVVRSLEAPGYGSMFVATHPRSRHLWLDTPLNEDPAISQGIAVYAIDALDAGYRRLAVAQWAGLDDGPARVVQPSFTADGREVWLLVSNEHDKESALVVVDDATLELREVIREPRLLTPSRLYGIPSNRP